MPALDGLRGLAILMVMVHHCTVFQPRNGAEEWLHFVSGFGGFGVDLFFVLSGFLITGILFDAKGTDATGVGGRTPAGRFFGNFYARRTLRIFPLYYAVVFVSLVLFPHAGSLLQSVAGPSTAAVIQSKLDRFAQVDGYDAYFWLYLSNFPIAWTGTWLHGILGVCWSLAIEEQFYLVWPLVIYLLSRKGAVRVCFGLIVVALAIRVGLTVVLLRQGYEPTVPLANPTGIYVLTFTRMDTLAFGALLALTLRGGSVHLARLVPAARRVMPVALVCLVVMAVVEELVGPQRALFDAGCGPVYQTVGYLLNGVVGAGALVLALAAPAGSVWGGVWRSRLLVTLGKYSYALYLFHLPIRAVVRDVVFGPRVEGGGGPKVAFFEVAGSQVPAQAVFTVVSIALTLAAAWVSWRVLEKPFLSLKRFFPSGSEKAQGR